MATHSSILAWKIPWTEERGRLQSMGSLRVRHDWETSLSLFTFHSCALEREMATHSSVLAWRIPGTGEPGGLPSMGLHRVGHDWSDLVRVEYSKICNCIGVPASNSAITCDQETFWKKFISKTKFCTHRRGEENKTFSTLSGYSLWNLDSVWMNRATRSGIVCK